MTEVVGRQAVIVAAKRSPIGRAHKGSLQGIRPDDLAAQIVGEAVRSVPGLDARQIDDLLLGCGLPGGEAGFNMARVVAVLAGLPDVPGTTLTRYCASSVQTTRNAMHAIRSGEGDVFISAGVETISRYGKGSSDSIPDTMNPIFDEAQARSRARALAAEPWNVRAGDGDPIPDVYISMGQTAENVAQLCGVTREEQDEFAYQSQARARIAQEAGFWAREITPVVLPDGSTVHSDDSPRPSTTLEALSALKPAFRTDGTVTAGNACPLNDGAAALVIMSHEKARALGCQPLARIVATGVSALNPEIMGLGPVEATRRALALAGMSMQDMDLVEINEAFAAQVIPSARELGIDSDRLNVAGGSIAVGHPFGMTGARMTVTLLNALNWHDKELGLVSMCVAGGQGMALIIERLA